MRGLVHKLSGSTRRSSGSSSSRPFFRPTPLRTCVRMYRPAETPVQPAKKRPQSPAELPTERLEHELCQLASHLSAAIARWISLVDEFDRRESWGKWGGVLSTSHWISWQCACSLRTARDYVRVARALRELPLTREAFSSGELSYSKVRAPDSRRHPRVGGVSPPPGNLRD